MKSDTTAVDMHALDLDWDSEFFGFKVVRITHREVTAVQVDITLRRLKGQGVRLAYWPLASPLQPTDVERHGGRLVDRKTTFRLELNDTADREDSTDSLVEPYSEFMSMHQLEDLAVQSGAYSRFASDPQVPRGKCEQLYRMWIRQSVLRENANEVLVIRQKGSLLGVVTLGEKNGHGNIGLLAVDRSARGKGYGERLVGAAEGWFRRRNYSRAQVVTQGENVAACRLYKKCGYRIEQVDYFYHFWL